MPAWLTRRRTGWLSVWLARLSEFRERVQPCPFMFVCSCELLLADTSACTLPSCCSTTPVSSCSTSWLCSSWTRLSSLSCMESLWS
ncbi:hypothetical protein BC831DRAFT_459737 [Entophlyctis helioformis]|nr:hypothetical protein BC831DRAFT_459737 [Entophlyctis helioformis]